MRRRKYLALGGAFLTSGLAGCGGGTEDIDDPQSTDRPDDNGNGNGNGDGDGGGDDPTEEPGDQTPTEPPGDPDVAFGDRQLVKDDSGFSTEAYAEVIVENSGDGSTGQVEVVAEWYDADGNFLGDDSGFLPSLDGGETWIAQVSALSADAEDIEDIEIRGDFNTGPPVAPENMSVTESEVVVEEFSSEITGVAENNREETTDYVEAHGKIYDGDGNVIGGGWTNETELPANRDWRFEILLSGRAAARAENAADHVAFLDADFF